MGVISFGSNIAALRALRRLNDSSNDLARTSEKLSSGQRINRASDDAASLAISSSLRKDVNVYSQALRNGGDAISALSIVEGSLTQLSSVLMRLKELATQASNGTFSLTQRLSLDEEGEQLTLEFNRIVGSTEFNGINLLNGLFGRMNVQLGYGTNGSIGFGVGQELDRNKGTGFQDGSQFVAASTVPTDPDLADLNGDGNLDLIVRDSTSIRVSMGNGDGTFRSQTSYSFSEVSALGAVGDLNGDGILDLVTGGATLGVGVRYGVGDGTFGAETRIAVGGNVSGQVILGDFNGDGTLDVAGSSTSSSSVFMAQSNGAGGYSLSSYAAGANIRSLTVGNLNSDGFDDLLIKDSSGDLRIGLGKSGSGLTAGSTIDVTSTNSGTIEVADFNFDGILDVVASGGTSLNVLLGNGDGTFQTATNYSVGSTQGISTRDMNGDGIPDLTYATLGSIRFLRGIGDGSFATETSFTATLAAGRFAVGDINGDGVPDLLGADASAPDSIQTALATTTTTTSIERFNLTTQQSARDALSQISSALDRLSRELGAIGGAQSRINVALGAIAASRENSAAAESRIMSADVAIESANMIRLKILQEAGAAVLGQANTQPSLALTLLSSTR